jgi:hypothetical protein
MSVDGTGVRQVTHNKVDDILSDWQPLHDVSALKAHAIALDARSGRPLRLRFHEGAPLHQRLRPVGQREPRQLRADPDPLLAPPRTLAYLCGRREPDPECVDEVLGVLV